MTWPPPVLGLWCESGSSPGATSCPVLPSRARHAPLLRCIPHAPPPPPRSLASGPAPPLGFGSDDEGLSWVSVSARVSPQRRRSQDIKVQEVADQQLLRLARKKVRGQCASVHDLQCVRVCVCVCVRAWRVRVRGVRVCVCVCVACACACASRVRARGRVRVHRVFVRVCVCVCVACSCACACAWAFACVWFVPCLRCAGWGPALRRPRSLLTTLRVCGGGGGRADIRRSSMQHSTCRALNALPRLPAHMSLCMGGGGEAARQGGAAMTAGTGNQNGGDGRACAWEAATTKGMAWPASPRRYRVPGQPLLNRHLVGGVSRSPDGLFAQQEREPTRGRPAVRGGRTYGGRPGQRVEEQGTWASQKHSEAGYGRPVDRGAWAAKTVKRPPQQPAQPPRRQLLGATDAQTAHPATSSTAPAHQLLGSANAETTPAGAPAAAADRKQRPDATCGGKNG